MKFLRCIWTPKSLSFSAKNNTTASRQQIADLSGDVIYLRNVKFTSRITQWEDNRLVDVCQGEMDGTSIVLRQPKLYPAVRRGHHVDNIRLKEFNNVSALIIYINTSNK